MPLAKIWAHGGVEYPLTDSTENDLLRDADPALHFALEFFEFGLNAFVKDRLIAQAALHGFNFPSAVAHTLHFEPTPYLLGADAVFPLLAIYRSEEGWDEHTIAHDKDVATWEWCYVLPPLTPVQIRALNPIFRSVSVVMRVLAMQSFDPRFEDSKPLRDLAGIQKMVAGPVRYGNFEEVEGQNKWWRAVSGKLVVLERDVTVDSAFQPYTGADISIDHTEASGDQIQDFVQVSVDLPPLIDSVAPISGSKAGGTPMIITGSDFRVGTMPKVLVGGAFASNVYVVNANRITCLSPAHDASPTFVADVQVLAADGQESNVLEDAFTFTTP